MQRKSGAAAFFGIILALALSACSPGTSNLVPPRDASLGGHILFRVDGGLAGVRQSLSIEDSGLALARDERRGTEARRQLSAAQLAELKAAFANADGRKRPAPQPLPDRCRDCLQFTLLATIDGKRHVMRTHVPARSPAYREAMTLLSETLRDMLSTGEDLRK